MVDVITVASQHGAGKTTLVKNLAARLPGFKLIIMGDKFREEAKARAMTIEAFMAYLLEDEKASDAFDNMVDEWLEKELAKGSVIADSSVGPKFAPPGAFHIFIKCDLDERARRVFKGKARKSDAPVTSVEEVKKNLKERDENDQKRYLRLYNHDIFDMNHYDLIIDTTDKTPDETLQIVLEALK